MKTRKQIKVFSYVENTLENSDIICSSPKSSPKSSHRQIPGKQESEDHFNVPYKNCFQKIFKVRTHRKNRLRHTATTGWTSKLALIFWNARKLSCVSAWRRANVSKKLIKCEGYCAMPGCSAILRCEATANNLQFTIIGRNPQFLHDPDKKRRILHIDKPVYEKMLDGKTAHKVYAQLLDELMSDGDPVPSIAPGPNQLRQTKSNADRPRNVTPFVSLSMLRQKYPGAIHSIRYDPFFTIHVYNSPITKEKSCVKRHPFQLMQHHYSLGTPH